MRDVVRHDTHASGSAPRALEPLQAIWRITSVLPPLKRAYAATRFAIVRPKLLTMIDLVLPAQGRILDIGSGFGLFASYMSLVGPEREILGVEPSGRRVESATSLARDLGLERVRFIEGTVDSAPITGTFDAILAFDVLHHVPEADQVALLSRFARLLSPRGVLVVKDVTTDRPIGVALSYLTDWTTSGIREPICYRHHHEWEGMLVTAGFRVRTVRVDDVVPYPHVIFVATPNQPP